MTPEDSSESHRRDTSIFLDAMVQQGWLIGWGSKGGEYVTRWTAKGQERRDWFRRLDEDLRRMTPDTHSYAEALVQLCSICTTPSDDITPPTA